MSCDLAAAAFLFLAAAGPGAAPAPKPPMVSVAREPLYADIIQRAGRLKAQTDAYRKAGALSGFEDYATAVAQLAELDMKGHLDLAARGTDGDLKCILKGISVDLNKRLGDLKAATDWTAQDAILRDMAYLLDDNVGVIAAPPTPPV